MSQRNTNILVGFFVLITLIVLTVLALKSSNIKNFNMQNTFELKAYFRDISGLNKNSKVILSGVQIGKIKNLELDPKHNFDVLITVSIDKRFENIIPDDSSIEVLTAGLLGEKYLGITIGGSDTYLNNNDEISFTGSAIVLEKLIQQVIGQIGLSKEN